ncbi:alpha/beta fold hydrolase [Actinomadura montaniterrae]|uniref:Alpha/beta fold hydrolase n=1 Tax=Actinomadura montaniterrae TaxID=1803903 RepID=A0A6L3VC68_9ACTN|nr:alpha/beta fold hydrolase [Actinomadura montaniterrae]KAB2353630.1 alpha/beta fold hydrolase [Actinomadura montaniterrae]
MATFVLVPGFWLGAWAWEEVAAGLRDAGHDARAVTLKGLAERAGELTPEVGLDDHIADVVAAVADAGPGPVVLVAHSGANMAVTGAADRLGDRVSRVVYVDSGPMPSGMAGIDFRAPDERAELEKTVAEEGDGWTIPVPPFDAGADPVSLEGLSAERLAEMRRRGTPQPFATATQPLERPEPLPDTPRTLVLCTIPLPAVKQMAAGGNPVFAPMAGPGWTYRELPTGHWPMFSKPRELAALLAESAAQE